MAELSKGPMPDQVTAMAMYQHAPNPNGVGLQRLVKVDRTPIASVAANQALAPPCLMRKACVGPGHWKERGRANPARFHRERVHRNAAAERRMLPPARGRGEGPCHLHARPDRPCRHLEHLRRTYQGLSGSG